MPRAPAHKDHGWTIHWGPAPSPVSVPREREDNRSASTEFPRLLDARPASPRPGFPLVGIPPRLLHSFSDLLGCCRDPYEVAGLKDPVRPPCETPYLHSSNRRCGGAPHPDIGGT